MATPPFAGGNGEKRAAMTRKEFLDKAPDFVTVKIGDIEINARAKLFNPEVSRSVGFGFNGKLVFPCQRGKLMSCSVNGQSVGTSDFYKGGGDKGNWLYHFGGKITLQEVKDDNEVPVEYQVGINVIANKSGKIAASDMDKLTNRECMVGVNITAIGSGDKKSKKGTKKGWQDGGDLSGWIKVKREEEDEEDEDEDEDEEEKDEDEDEDEEDEKPAKTKLKKKAKAGKK